MPRSQMQIGVGGFTRKLLGVTICDASVFRIQNVAPFVTIREVELGSVLVQLRRN